LILSGRVKGYTRDASGKELVMSICEAGEILGKMALHGGLCNHSSRGDAVKQGSDLSQNRILRRL